MSVDGQYIAFMGYQGDTMFVYIMHETGENIRLISERPNSKHPIISPDNEIIAFKNLKNVRDKWTEKTKSYR